MEPNEFTREAMRLMRRARHTVEQARNVLEEVLDDDILSAPIVGGDEGGSMKATILDQARDKVAQLQKEVRAAFELKQKLEAQSKGIQLREQENENRFTVPSLRFGRLFGRERSEAQTEKISVVQNAEQVEIDENTRAWLRVNAPDKLPKAAPPPVLTIQQQAQYAHSDYADLCNRLLRAKRDLAQLEKRVADAAEILRCVQEAAA